MCAPCTSERDAWHGSAGGKHPRPGGPPPPRRAGKTALAWATRALGVDGKASAVLYNVGCLYAVLGRPADALRCLRKVVRSGWRKEWIRHDPDWTALRNSKEFVALV